MLVSILIPCYNAERWIAQCIQSALDQTWPEKEVIVVDDGSTDGSLAIIQSFGDRVRWETGPNRGGNVARNRLLELARGEWVQYLDADDYLLPGKIEAQVRHLDLYPANDVVVSPVAWERVVDGELRRTQTPIDGADDLWVMLAHWKLPQTGGALWRKVAIRNAGGWASNQHCCQEHELYLRLLMTGARVTKCAGCHAIYRDFTGPDRVTQRSGAALLARQRLVVLERMEGFLFEHGWLTRLRRQALNDARHAMARAAWKANPEVAEEALAQVRHSDPSFRPSPGPASPWTYRVAIRLLGFRHAEKLAAWRRGLRWSFGPLKP